MNRPTNGWMDQGGSVPLVHIAALTGRVCPPLPLPRPAGTAVIDRQGRRVNWTSHGDWPHGSVVVQGHTPVRFGSRDVATTGHPFVTATPRCWLDAATKAMTSWRQLTITYARRRFWPIYTDLLSADIGLRIIHRSTDFYTVTKI